MPCHWDKIGKAVQITRDSGSKTLILGNGDVKDLRDAHEKVKIYGVDGVMIGRAIFGNVYLFNKSDWDMYKSVTLEENLRLYFELCKYFDEDEPKGFHLARLHVKGFLKGFENVRDLRRKLSDPSVNNSTKTIEIIQRYLEINHDLSKSNRICTQ